jgi:CheY-like chemotaxis protein
VLASPLALVVDDDAAVCSLIQRLILRARPDIAVQTASTGTKALALILAAAPALLISDVTMPGMSGIALLEALRAAGLHIPTIIISGDAAHERAALLAGAHAFVEKINLARALPPLLNTLLPPAP